MGRQDRLATGALTPHALKFLLGNTVCVLPLRQNDRMCSSYGRTGVGLALLGVEELVDDLAVSLTPGGLH